MTEHWVSALESWAPVIGAGIIVGGAATVQLGIYIHKIKERRRNLERKRMNAVKDLYWGLRAASYQGWFTNPEVNKVDPRYSFLLYPEDIGWLRQHFHEYGHLFSTKIHESYHKDITDTRTRPIPVNAESVPSDIRKFVLPGPVFGGNLTRLFLAVKLELFTLDPDVDIPDDKMAFPEQAHDAANSSTG